MYKCQDCDTFFEKLRTSFEKHGLDCPPYEARRVCPECGSDNWERAERKYCRCCGLPLPYGTEGYCNESCRNQGEKMWARQHRRRQKAEADPLLQLARELAAYNAEHGTRYSYGTYVATVRPRLKKKKGAVCR